jgi:hypothetical protein
MPIMSGGYLLKNSSVTFDGVEYKNSLSAAALTPSQEIQTLRTLDPTGTIQDVDSATWTFDITVVQSNDPDSLHAYLLENAGTEIEIVYQPSLGSGKRVATFTVIFLAPSFGGVQGAFPSSDLSLPVQGTPVYSVSA